VAAPAGTFVRASFPVRHDPATGRYLKEGQGAGAPVAEVTVAGGFKAKFSDRGAYYALLDDIDNGAAKVQALFPDDQLTVEVQGFHPPPDGTLGRTMPRTAWATTWPGPPGQHHPVITVNPDFGGNDSRRELVGKMENSARAGDHPINISDPEGMMAHEFGHVISRHIAVTRLPGHDTDDTDPSGLTRLEDNARFAVREARKADPHWPQGFSGYGYGDNVEAVAEAIAHVAEGGRDRGALAIVRYFGGRPHGPMPSEITRPRDREKAGA
jgi:hypothetical protein